MKNYLYKFIIHDATDHCYKNCLEYFGADASILDVGIGNGLMLKTYHPVIKKKGLNIIGLDINKSYLNHCDSLIHAFGLENNIQICQQPVEKYEPPAEVPFDFILFSMSFMLLQDQRLVLDRVKKWLRPDGKLIFFQTVFKNRFRTMEYIKPRLKYFTTIDFGSVTYEGDFFDLLAEQRITTLEDRLIKRTWFRGEYRMIIAAPA